jgi:hypothetical protein
MPLPGEVRPEFEDFIWIHLDMTHSGANGLLSAANARMSVHFPGAILSVNLNVAGTESIVKVFGTEADFVDALPPPMKDAPIAVFTANDRDAVYAMVTSEAWTGPIGSPV